MTDRWIRVAAFLGGVADVALARNATEWLPRPWNVVAWAVLAIAGAVCIGWLLARLQAKGASDGQPR